MTSRGKGKRERDEGKRIEDLINGLQIDSDRDAQKKPKKVVDLTRDVIDLTRSQAREVIDLVSTEVT